MSIIKDIYDVTKDATQFATKKSAIKRALRTELKEKRGGPAEGFINA